MILVLAFVAFLFWGLVFFVFFVAEGRTGTDVLFGRLAPPPEPHNVWFEVQAESTAELVVERRHWFEPGSLSPTWLLQCRERDRRTGEVVRVRPDQRVRRRRAHGRE